MYATVNMKRKGTDRTRTKRDNSILAAGVLILVVFIFISSRLGLARKWNTVSFGTFVPFIVVVQTYPRRWRRVSFWSAFAICLIVHLVAMWVIFEYIFVHRAPGWVLWLPVAFGEGFALMALVRVVEEKLLKARVT